MTDNFEPGEFRRKRNAARLESRKRNGVQIGKTGLLFAILIAGIIFGVVYLYFTLNS